MVLRPNLITSVQKLICERVGVDSVELGGLHTDVVETDVYRRTLEAPVFFLIESISVEVVVQRVVVHHLRYGKVVEETRVIRDAQILGEDLHEQ